MTTDVSAEALRRAASLKDQIEKLQAQYEALLGGTAPRRGRKPGSATKTATFESPAPVANKRRKKRKMSPEARARIAAAAKARWARVKAGK